MCQDAPTGLYTRWELDTDMQNFKARHNQSRIFEKVAKSFYEKQRQESKIETFFTSGNRKNWLF